MRTFRKWRSGCNGATCKDRHMLQRKFEEVHRAYMDGENILFWLKVTALSTGGVDCSFNYGYS
jgi:hypothetical protein